jgi:hypothetical protein
MKPQVEAKDGSRTLDCDRRALDTMRAGLKLLGLEPLLKLTQIHGDVREREPPTEHVHRRLAANPNVAPRNFVSTPRALDFLNARCEPRMRNGPSSAGPRPAAAFPCPSAFL